MNDQHHAALLAEHKSIVDSEVRVCLRRFNYRGYVEFDDLAQAGRVALLSAAESFDGRGELSGYLRQRVRWAVTDEARALSPFKRTQWSKVLSGEGYLEIVSLNAARRIPAPCSASVDPIQALRVRAAWTRLSRRLRHVLRKRHLEGQPIAEIGRSIGVGSSRVCQLVREGERELHRLAIAQCSLTT